MDAAAYLKKHGWRGTGHSLDHNDRGIVKPLQISKKVDALGVGIQKYAAVSDQWWLRAYNEGLKDLGTGKESALAIAKKHGVHRGGLYARFVRGTDIPGTIGQRTEHKTSIAVAGLRSKSDTADLPSLTGMNNKKRKRTTLSDDAASPHLVVMQQINAYVLEARKRGILSQENASNRSSVHSPSDKDMQAVLRLAKMQKLNKASAKDEKKLIRNLKRAALRYLETQQKIGAPG